MHKSALLTNKAQCISWESVQVSAYGCSTCMLRSTVSLHKNSHERMASDTAAPLTEDIGPNVIIRNFTY